MRWTRSRLAAVAVIMAVVACESSPFEPRGDGERVPVGPVIEDSLVSDSVKWYSFDASANERFAIFLESRQGYVQLAVYDSLQPFFPGPTLSAVAGGPRLDENATAPFGSGGRAVYRLRFQGFVTQGGVAHYRFKVYRIDQSPERVPELFSIGDTVTGETIDPMVDLDHFVARGEAGQQIVAVLQTQGLPANAAVYLSVTDHTTNNFFGYVTAAASPLTSGRVRLPSTGDYDFRASSVISNTYPLYHGPYRFWTYVVNPGPEHRSAALSFNTPITGEHIDRAGDLDEFTFSAAAGADFVGFVQGAGRTFQLEVAPSGGEAIASASSVPSDTGLFTHGTNRFHVTTAGTYITRVTASAPNDPADTGAYRVFLHAVDRRPEHVTAAITPGDTVSGEDIAIPGDIDEFTFNGSAGEQYDAFLQSLDGSPDTYLQLDVLNPAGTLIAFVQSIGSDTSLLRQVTGRFVLPTTGTYRVRVSGTQAYNDHDRGPYRFVLYRVDRKPELQPDTLAFGDSLSGEAIDVPGDFDEFRVHVPDSSGANLVFGLDASPVASGVLTVSLIDSVTGRIAATMSSYQAGEQLATGPISLARGTYIVRVDGSQALDRSILRGTYHLWFYRFGFGPEAIADTFAIGDTVSGEVIAPWGDVDRLRFYGIKGQHINIALQGQATQGGGGFQAWVQGPAGSPVTDLLSVASGAVDVGLHDHQTMRVDLPVTGWYQVEMTGFGPTQGPYRLLVEPVGTAPETATAALVPGDSVTTEALDVLGDWDEFIVTAPVGSDIGIVVHGSIDPPYTRLWVLDPSTLDTLGQTVSQFLRVLGPIPVPGGGQVHVAVFQPVPFVRFCYDATCAGIFNQVGPYNFTVIAINRLPENVGASYVIGDTVRGDAIDPLGDVDEFTSSGVPGERLIPEFRLTTDPVPAGSLFRMEIVDPATGAILIGDAMAIFRATPNYLSPGAFTVPASGTFVIRMRSGGFVTRDTDHGTAPYEFVVRR